MATDQDNANGEQPCNNECIDRYEARLIVYQSSPAFGSPLENPWQHQRRGRRSGSGQQPMRRNEGLQRGQRQNVCIGRGKCQGLRGIDSRNESNMTAAGTFISKLHPKTSSAQLAVFIHREFGLTVRPEKLPNRLGLYSSFFIPGSHTRKMMNADIWPAGTLVKPFVQQ
jgi:hypothetical protein